MATYCTQCHHCTKILITIYDKHYGYCKYNSSGRDMYCGVVEQNPCENWQQRTKDSPEIDVIDLYKEMLINKEKIEAQQLLFDKRD
jgi:hypothetical protein